MDYEQELDEYLAAKSSAALVLSKIHSNTNKPISKICWVDFYTLLEKNYHVDIQPYSFSGKLAEIFAGSLYFDNGLAIIGYNNSRSQAINRQHFTIMHEGVHYLDDALAGAHEESFSDLIDNKNYSEKELVRERHADYTASILMCNDSALEESMQQYLSLLEMVKKFEMTKTAIFVRLINYLHFNIDLVQNNAVYLANAYCKGDSPERRSFLPFFINNREAILSWGKQEVRTPDTAAELYWETGHNDEMPGSYWYQLQKIFGYYQGDDIMFY